LFRISFYSKDTPGKKGSCSIRAQDSISKPAQKTQNSKTIQDLHQYQQRTFALENGMLRDGTFESIKHNKHANHPSRCFSPTDLKSLHLQIVTHYLACPQEKGTPTLKYPTLQRQDSSLDANCAKSALCYNHQY